MTGTLRRRGPDVTGAGLSALLLISNLVTVLLLPSVATELLAVGGDHRPSRAELLHSYGVAGDSRFPSLAVSALSAVLLLLLAAIDVPLVRLLSARTGRAHVDATARLGTRRADTRRAGTASTRATAARLGYPSAPPGVYIGRAMRDGRDLWGSWEEVHVDISGPRTGKTSCRVIPNIVAAPGAVVITSCKLDVVDATRGVRGRRGRVWVFDPHGLVGEPPTWYRNPLTMVDRNMKDAIGVAGLIAFTRRKQHMRSDGYFEPAAENLVAMFLLAANLDDRPITVLRHWLLRPRDDEPATILRREGHPEAALSCESTAGLPEDQRSGIYGAALQLVSWPAAPEIVPWITPGPGRVRCRPARIGNRRPGPGSTGPRTV